MNRFLFLLIGCAACSCGLLGISASPYKSVPGKIAFDDPKYFRYNIVVPGGKDVLHVSFKPDSGGRTGEVNWVHRDDHLIGLVQYGGKHQSVRSKIVEYDLDGKIVRTIRKSSPGELLEESPFLMPSDSLMVFASVNTHDPSLVIDTTKISPRHIIVADFRTGAVTQQIETQNRALFVDFNESPWVTGENSFIYSVVPDTAWRRNGIINGKTSLVFIYDLNSGTERFLFKETRGQVCSPSQREIAFARGKTVWVYNLDTNSEKMIYAVKHGDVVKLHYTPDGKSLFVRSTAVFTRNSFLIDVASGNELPSSYPEMSVFTWK